MRKSHLFIAAGTAFIISGCSTPITKPIMGDKTVIPAPADDPAAAVQQSNPQTGVNNGQEQSSSVRNDAPSQSAAQLPQFEPMTDAVSSGGIESPVKTSSKKGKMSATAASGTYVVRRGDTPERIARRLRVRLSALMAANNLDETSARKLQVGQKLIIPDGKAAPAKSSAKVKAKSNAGTAAPAALNDDGTYTVRRGDSPERIARRHHVRLSELLKANNLDENSARKLQIGQKLVIPGRSAAREVAAPKDATTTQPEVKIEQSADTASTVQSTDAVQTETAPKTEPTAQPVADTQSGVGQSEVIVVELTEDMTLAALAAKYNSTEAEISKLNSDKTEFKRSDMIFVPKK